MAARARASRAPAPPAAVPGAATRAWWPPLLVALVALSTYANSLDNGFVWDDPVIIERQLVVFDSVAAVLSPPRDIPQFSPDYYRPVTIATYLIDRAAGGERPFAFHLSVVVAHAVTAALLWALAAQLLGGRPGAAAGALCAGLLFAVHPIHSESVAWAAGRSDVLATAFLLAVLLVLGIEPPSGRRGLLGGLAALGALGAKEAGVALYPLQILRDLLIDRRRRSPADWLRRYGGIAGAGVLYVLLRRSALGEVVGTAPGGGAVSRSPLDVLAAAAAYVAELLWPWPLNAYIDEVPVSVFTIAAGAAFAAGLVAAAWRWRRRRDGLPLFALAWTALTLVPSLAILWKIPDAPLAERYLYLPSAGFCLLAGVLAARLAGRVPRPIGLAFGLATLITLGLGTAARNRVWHDDVALWEDTESKSQASGMAARNLGAAYQKAGRADEARAAFARALARRNDALGLQTIHNNLGTLAMMDGDYAGAQRAYEQALAAAPDQPDPLFNLGLAILHGGGATADAARRALPYLERARAANPHDADIEAGLGQILLILDEPRRACDHLRRARALRPSPHTAAGIRTLMQSCPD